MNWPEFSLISSAKVEALKSRLETLRIDLHLVEENFSRGSGKGGQKVNKTSNAVTLHYPPLNLTIKVHRERERSLNRFLALRELVDQIEMKISPNTSQKLKDWNRLRKQKDRRRRRVNS
jgi:protein subunit release factor B